MSKLIDQIKLAISYQEKGQPVLSALKHILADAQALERDANMLQTETNALLAQIEARTDEDTRRLRVDARLLTRKAKREAYAHALQICDDLAVWPVMQEGQTWPITNELQRAAFSIRAAINALGTDGDT